jgi:ribonucleoside-diphosphate reductase subunit M1
MYYLRTKAAADAIKFTVDQAGLASKAALDKERSTSVDLGDGAKAAASEEEARAQMVCSIDNREDCLSCGA